MHTRDVIGMKYLEALVNEGSIYDSLKVVKRIVILLVKRMNGLMRLEYILNSYIKLLVLHVHNVTNIGSHKTTTIHTKNSKIVTSVHS